MRSVIAGAAVVPTAPLLVPGVSATLPDGVGKVADAIDAVVDRLPRADVAVLLATGPQGVHDSGMASLAGIGRPDIRADTVVSREAVAKISETTQYPLYREKVLPLGLSVLALLLGSSLPVTPVSVPEGAGYDALVGVGTGVAKALDDAGMSAVVLAAGDLSAGLTPKSPRPSVSGAVFWDEQAVAAVDSGRLDGLARLGPEEAQRVFALGWPPMVVLHGAVARAKIGMIVRHYSAPRGVGYLVAQGA